MVPNSLRLVAEVTLDLPAAGAPRRLWLRILGDDERGYLMVGDIGAEAGIELDDFWFPTLEEMMAAAERVGVARDAWDLDYSTPAATTRRARAEDGT
jgi:hypothetical protein